MQPIDAVNEYSRSSAERLLAVDDRPEETVSNSLILIISILYYVLSLIRIVLFKYRNIIRIALKLTKTYSTYNF